MICAELSVARVSRSLGLGWFWYQTAYNGQYLGPL